MFNTKHITTTRDETAGFQTMNTCLVCGDKNFISDRADAKAQKSNENWFAYKHKGCGETFKARNLETAKAKVAEILSSNHIASVEVALEEDMGNARIYSAISRDTGIPHLYRVRVTEEFNADEKVITAQCNCLSKVKCRHIIKVTEVDAQIQSREIYPFEIVSYKAHQFSERRAA